MNADKVSHTIRINLVEGDYSISSGCCSANNIKGEQILTKSVVSERREYYKIDKNNTIKLEINYLLA